MTSYDRERAVARDAACLAGRLCLAVRQEMLGSLNNDAHQERLEKVGHEPVTIADYGAQAIVLSHIAEYFPDDGSLAEERAAEFDTLATSTHRERVIYHLRQTLGTVISLEDARRWLDHGRDQATERIWTVDPIDGTKGFLRGDQFAVAVALIVSGQPVVAALACPLLPLDPDNEGSPRGVVASAIRGQGAALEPLEGSRVRPLHVSPVSHITQARTLESIEPGHTDHVFSAQVLDSAGVGGKPVRMDSQAKYVAVADGRAEIYIRNSRGGSYREKVWDHAAGALIVEEAGGCVTDLDGKRLDFSSGDRLANNRGVLATNGAFHDTLLKAIRQHI